MATRPAAPTMRIRAATTIPVVGLFMSSASAGSRVRYGYLHVEIGCRCCAHCFSVVPTVLEDIGAGPFRRETVEAARSARS